MFALPLVIVATACIAAENTALIDAIESGGGSSSSSSSRASGRSLPRTSFSRH